MLQGLGLVDAAVALADAQPTGEVVEGEGGGVGAGHALVDDAVAAEQGDEEGQGRDQMRGVLEQALALVQGLVHEAEVALLEVAQAPVHHLRGLRRGARSEVVALDEGGAKSPRGGIESDTGAGDAAPDHEDVEGLLLEPGQGPRSGPEWPARPEWALGSAGRRHRGQPATAGNGDLQAPRTVTMGVPRTPQC